MHNKMKKTKLPVNSLDVMNDCGKATLNEEVYMIGVFWGMGSKFKQFK